VNKKNREWKEAQGERERGRLGDNGQRGRKNHRGGERMCEERAKGERSSHRSV
jgi:hypothetical protein